MVRPIEISDSLSKSESAQRMLQNQKMQPEATQQFQKELTGKLAVQVTTPNPVPKGDEVVLHVDEREEEKEKIAQHEEPPDHENAGEETDGQEKNEDDEDFHSQEHIDIKA
ncbi:hypothetical protein ACFL5B_00580 [Candidatus Latescibacterota bacterium]